MKRNLKLLFGGVLVFLTSTQLTAQTVYPIEQLASKARSIQEKVNKIDIKVISADAASTSTDSIASSNPTPSNKTIIRTVYDGSKNLDEKRTLKFAGDETVVRVGKGDFKNILYIDKLTNQVMKVKHIDTMKYLYDVGEDEKANTERIEVDLYYENEQLFYAVFKEDHYKNETELLFSNKYEMQMTSHHKDVYFTNEFQKTIYNYIKETSDSVLKQK